MASTLSIVILCFFSLDAIHAMGPPSPTPIPTLFPSPSPGPLNPGVTPLPPHAPFSPGSVPLGTPAPIHLYTPKPFLSHSPPPLPGPTPLPPHPAVPHEEPVPLPANLPNHPPPQSPPVYLPPPPQEYGHCNPRIPPYCANLTGLHYCLEDPHYPEYEIKLAISQDYLFDKKYSDVVDQSANDLVEGIYAEQEDLLDYRYYSGVSKGRSPYDLSHWTGPEGYLCPSDVIYAMPRRARNVNGDWRVVVNGVQGFSQTARFETCLFPDSACRLLAPCYQSKCTQKYIYHRMLAFDPCDPYKGLFLDVFKFASACSCHIPQP